MTLPTINMISQNLTEVAIDELTIYYSYTTPVAFHHKGVFNISENIWSRTTSKHLNIIHDDKAIRIPNPDFLKKLAKIKVTGGK
jgi:hypothetical protein